MDKRIKNLIGQKFGRLLVIEITDQRKNYAVVWKCRCDCGNIHFVAANDLTRKYGGGVKSCGCLRHDTNSIDFGEASKNVLFYGYKRSARKKKLEFKLLRIEFYEITQKICYYCGRLPYNETKNKFLNGTFKYNGIDRVDNNLGYTIENCVPCCMICNRAKNNLPIFEFIKWLNDVCKYRNESQNV